MQVFDMNGVELYVGADVEMPTPNDEDLWNYEFEGVVTGTRGNGLVMVEDGDGDVWEVEPNRLTLL